MFHAYSNLLNMEGLQVSWLLILVCFAFINVFMSIFINLTYFITLSLSLLGWGDFMNWEDFLIFDLSRRIIIKIRMGKLFQSLWFDLLLNHSIGLKFDPLGFNLLSNHSLYHTYVKFSDGMSRHIQ
jgi:hypothetical protein